MDSLEDNFCGRQLCDCDKAVVETLARLSRDNGCESEQKECQIYPDNWVNKIGRTADDRRRKVFRYRHFSNNAPLYNNAPLG